MNFTTYIMSSPINTVRSKSTKFFQSFLVSVEMLHDNLEN